MGICPVSPETIELVGTDQANLRSVQFSRQNVCIAFMEKGQTGSEFLLAWPQACVFAKLRGKVVCSWKG